MIPVHGRLKYSILFALPYVQMRQIVQYNASVEYNSYSALLGAKKY